MKKSERAFIIKRILDKKYPNPKNQPIRKLTNMFLFPLVEIKKSKDKVKKLI